jgi:hypothetical protein
MKEDIKKLLREAVGGENQTAKPEAKSGENKTRVNALYDRIKMLLNDNMFNHSEVINRLYGAGSAEGKDGASNRSLFRKKLNRETYEGTTYKFDEDELTKIVQILMDSASLIRKNLGKKGND